ncbi:YggS family pyridoxal phosphate-dependent enzyme [Bowdeniella nasicola]|uniref:YggS family pyridoxal phosphate-dependent enzyme n=1 Tax=Bowdeniella nasicola TaxID=208480 RepID=UPI000A4094B9|nr:YggS family pyridoxal phosphate-dependent enzyme [Bowdeniella nasicola]
MNPESICKAYHEVRETIARAARQNGRDPGEIELMLAIKTQQHDDVRAALDCGASLLGHNRVQELVATGEDLAAHGLTPELHLIGPLQRNKVNHTLRWATGIQTLDRVEIIERISDALERLAGESQIAKRGRNALDVMIQVNTTGEESKSGCKPSEAVELAALVGSRENLRLVGLMTIGPNTKDSAEIRAAYRRMRELAAEIRESGADGTSQCMQLSMGMTNDIAEAIAEGATMVRVGRAVFGERF